MWCEAPSEGVMLPGLSDPGYKTPNGRARVQARGGNRGGRGSHQIHERKQREIGKLAYHVGLHTCDLRPK